MVMAILAGCLVGCRKGPGPGGKASITGKVFVTDYNPTFTLITGQFYGADVDVYLVYGDDVTYGDKVATHHDGTFEFKYLLPGTYTVYTYSKDKTGTEPSGDVVVQQTVEITGKKDRIVLDDLQIDD